MLTLTRRYQEAIVIDTPEGRIRILVLTKGVGGIRIGIDAPQSIKVMREELILLPPETEAGDGA